jgi:YD repeat-containing protein
MDRRQLLLGVTALGLATNLNLNHLLAAQLGKANVASRPSDRERAGLRGSVKTCSNFVGTETESMSEQEYAADGRLLFWRGRIFTGSVESIYSYDGTGKLIRVTSSGSGAVDEFHYDEQGKKTRVRTVPPRPRQEGMQAGTEIMFEMAEEGDDLNGGGTVTTRYNDDDQPVESLVRDAHGVLVTRITHNYANGRLVVETLVRENLDLPKEFFEQPPGEQLSEQQRREMRAQIKELLSQHGLDATERSYVYDNEGRVSRVTMQMSNVRIETSTTYNEHGDEAVTVRNQSGSLGEPTDSAKSAHIYTDRSEVRYFYEYDSHGNWTEKTDKTVDGSSFETLRKLTYY